MLVLVLLNERTNEIHQCSQGMVLMFTDVIQVRVKPWARSTAMSTVSTGVARR
jgi:hypothetical protein